MHKLEKLFGDILSQRTEIVHRVVIKRSDVEGWYKHFTLLDKQDLPKPVLNYNIAKWLIEKEYLTEEQVSAQTCHMTFEYENLFAPEIHIVKYAEPEADMPQIPDWVQEELDADLH